MSFKIRPSKFRHTFGEGRKKGACYEGVNLTSVSDGHLCSVNPKFVSILSESAGGGSFIVLPIAKTGRVDPHAPKVLGHGGPVIDIKWSPFNDNLIASASEDKTVKVWTIPDQGLVANLPHWTLDLHGHSKKIDILDWNPTAEGILLSSSQDCKCIIWNTAQVEPVCVIDVHKMPIYSASWNRDGSLICTTSKDKYIRIIDPRTSHITSKVLQENVGPRPSKSLFISDNKLISVGFSNFSERHFAIWDQRKLINPMKVEVIDRSGGVIMPFYDFDTKIIFLAGKGDGNIRYFEITNDASHVHYLSQYASSFPQKGMGCMPKRGCDPWKCEIMRFYKLHADKSLCEPISMIVPRRAQTFQADIFPPTNSIHPSTTADQWISGINREPVLMSLEDGIIVGKPKTTTCRAVQTQSQGSNLVNITTYHVVNGKGSTHTTANRGFTRQKSFPSSPVHGSESNQIHEPASIKNIRQLSLNTATAQLIPSQNGVMSEEAFGNHNIPLFVGTCHGDSIQQPRRSFITENGYSSHDKNDAEFKDAYISQIEEINSLKEQLTLKDKRIRQLEQDLEILRNEKPT